VTQIYCQHPEGSWIEIKDAKEWPIHVADLSAVPRKADSGRKILPLLKGP